MVKFITFDVWGTLIKNRSYKEERLGWLGDWLQKNGIGLPLEKIKEAYRVTNTRINLVRASENYRYVTLEERLTYLLRSLNIELPQHLILIILDSFQEIALKSPPLLFEDAKETLEKLSLTCKIGLISDTGFTSGQVLRRILDKYGMLDLFSQTVFSDETGFNKPHRIMFETILKGWDASPSEVVHVGDLIETDIIGAKSLGIKTIWIQRKVVQNTCHIKPDFEVTDLSQVLPILDNLILDSV
jgi:putative hydrolase of the HAD superfamily